MTDMPSSSEAQEIPPSEVETQPRGPFSRTEDFWAIVLGVSLLLGCLAVVVATGGSSNELGNVVKKMLAKPAGWESNPLASMFAEEKSAGPGVLLAVGVLGIAFCVGTRGMGKSIGRFVLGFLGVALLATVAYVFAGQSVIKSYNLEYALWALAIGLFISNTRGTPGFLKPAICTEFYIKTGLVMLGAEVLLPKLVALGPPGILVAWVVTPIVLITTFWFGQKVLRMSSPSLNMVISADMSVCGVSAAIATAAACKAKKEELSLAIGLSLSFTVLMMVVMPPVIRLTGMSDVLGGAWMGGTIDATGAVAAAGALLSDEALEVATTIKMIQNVLIGFTAFGVAYYWVSAIEKDAAAPTVGVGEIWRRFPKFILGFLGASILFSLVSGTGELGTGLVNDMIGGSKTLRGWCFCLAFISIGLDTDYRKLMSQFHGGKPLVLYVVGQTLNLVLTLAMAWLMFEVVFSGAADALQK